MVDPVPESWTPELSEIRTARLEAFSDGVLAIIVTIMVLEIRPPEEPTWAGLRPLIPILLAYVLSFVFIGIYWNNHHHLLRATIRIDGTVMWANLHLLFWLSLIPVGTAWIGKAHTHPLPAALWGVIALMAGVAYTILVLSIRAIDDNAGIAVAIGGDVKGKVSILMYAVGSALAFVDPWFAYAAFALVSVMWFIPDRRLAC